MGFTPKSVPDPVLSAYAADASSKYFTGTGFSTAGLLQIIAHVYGGGFCDQAFYIPTGAWTIHGRTEVHWNYGLPAYPSGYLRWYQPVGYDGAYPHDVLGDLLINQRYCSHGVVRIAPNYDQRTGSFTRSSGSGTFCSHVDEGVANKDALYLSTSVENDIIELGFDNLMPSNLAGVLEIRAKAWISIIDSSAGGASGGQCFLATLRHTYTHGSAGSGTAIGVPQYLMAQVHDTTVVPSFYEVRWRRQALSKAQGNSLVLQLEAKHYYGTPGTLSFRIDAVDLELIYECSDIYLIDEAAFESTTLQYYYYNQFSTYDYDLTVDFVDVDIDEAINLTLAHSPELFLFFDNETKWSVKLVPDYDDTPSPYAIGPAWGNFAAIDRTWTYDERVATRLKVNYATKRPAGLNTGPGASDPLNDENWKVVQPTKFTYKEKIDEQETEFDRPFFAGDTSGTGQDWGVLRFIDIYDRIFGEPIGAEDVAMLHSILVPQVGDVVSLDVPLSGFPSSKRLVVKKEIDLDEITGTVTLFDKDFTVDT